MTRFSGLLNTVGHLPESIESIKLAFTDTEHAKKLLMELNSLAKHHEISYIGKQICTQVLDEAL